MYTSQLLTTLSLLTLPLTILSAPAPAPAIAPRDKAQYWVTNAQVFRTEGKPEEKKIDKLFAVTVKGVNEGALEIKCTGSIHFSPDNPKTSAVLECPQDPNVRVEVASDLSTAFDISVQLA
ncbi:MAG: hypothetical protein Q9171_007291 [Xanthocarpia ochracea]